MERTEVRFERDGSFSVRAPCGGFDGRYRIDAYRLGTDFDFDFDNPCFGGSDEVGNVLAMLWTNPPQPLCLEGDEHRIVATSDEDGAQLELVAID
jgi:hypothetical protein